MRDHCYKGLSLVFPRLYLGFPVMFYKANDIHVLLYDL